MWREGRKTDIVLRFLQRRQGGGIEVLQKVHVVGGGDVVQDVVDTLFTVVPRHRALGVGQQLLVRLQSLSQEFPAHYSSFLNYFKMDKRGAGGLTLLTFPILKYSLIICFRALKPLLVSKGKKKEKKKKKKKKSEDFQKSGQRARRGKGKLTSHPFRSQG